MDNFRVSNLAISRTPLRVSFVGGGTDLPDFYTCHEGEVISSTIDKYIYVTAKRHNPIFEEKYRISYSQTELCNSLEDIQNGIARECLRLVGIQAPIYISTISDLPAKSGLGSSSSFTVGLLNALYALEGKKIGPAQLAEQACEIEISILGNKIGKQDQYAAAFGGINHYKFRRNGRVEIDPFYLSENDLRIIFSNLLLAWTRIQRESNEILLRQSSLVGKKIKTYNELKNYVQRFGLMLQNMTDINHVVDDIGQILENSFLLKRRLEDSITNAEIEIIHNSIKSLGGSGGKLCGAGGGGFLLEIINESIQDRVIYSLPEIEFQRISYEPHGSRIIVLSQ